MSDLFELPTLPPVPPEMHRQPEWFGPPQARGIALTEAAIATPPLLEAAARAEVLWPNGGDDADSVWIGMTPIRR